MNGSLKLSCIVLVFVTASLIFNMDFVDQSKYVFDSLGIDIEKMSEDGVEKILKHSTEEILGPGFYTYPTPTTIENNISKDKYEKLINLIDLEKDYNAILVRGYENDEYITARYYIETSENKKLENIISTYQETLVNAGYKENKNIYEKDGIEIKFINKWDCITLVVKGL